MNSKTHKKVSGLSLLYLYLSQLQKSATKTLLHWQIRKSIYIYPSTYNSLTETRASLNVCQAYTLHGSISGEQLPLSWMWTLTDNSPKVTDVLPTACTTAILFSLRLTRQSTPQTRFPEVVRAAIQFCCCFFCRSLCECLNAVFVRRRERKKGRKVSMGPGLFLPPCLSPLSVNLF